MHVAYWCVAGLMAVFFLYAGGIKIVRTKDALRPMMGWVDTMPLAGVRLIGTLEVLAAVGLILPPLTGIAPGLALAAAIGLLLVQAGAIVLHLRRGEARLLGLNGGVVVGLVLTAWLATSWI